MRGAESQARVRREHDPAADRGATSAVREGVLGENNANDLIIGKRKSAPEQCHDETDCSDEASDLKHGQPGLSKKLFHRAD